MSKNKNRKDEKKIMSEKEKNFDAEFSSEKTEPEKKYLSVYCGPDLLKYGLKKFRIYEGGLPLNVTNAATIIPEIMRLIVPYEQLEATRAKCEQKGTPEFEYYARIESAKIQ